MPGQPLVSVLINNYNYARYVGEAVGSALAQDYARVEVIVVDDGSTDDSRDVLEQFRGRVRLVFQENGGQGAAFNAGFAASSGDIVCFLDADDRFHPDKAATLARAYASRPGIGWCFHPLASFGPAAPSGTTPFSERDAEIDARAEMRRGRLAVIPPATSGLSFSRRLLSRLLPMPTELRITSDNYLKFAALGAAPGLLLGAPRAEQRLHGANAYTQRGRRTRSTGTIAMATAFFLRRAQPEIRRFANGLFARGVASAFWSGSWGTESRALASRYLREASMRELASITFRGCFNLLREVGR